MRRLKIDPLFHQGVVDFNKTLFDGRRSDFKQPKVELNKLLALKGTRKKYGVDNKIATAYITKIIDNYEDILSADHEKMADLILDFRGIIHEDKIPEKFWKTIVSTMQYKSLRGLEMLRFLQKFNIKTCVYCHSQLTLILNKKTTKTKTEIKGLLQLDHKHPKSKYPFLCTSFYNLYPICGNCNMAKSNKPTGFSFYCKDDKLDLFTFGLKNGSVLKYESSGNIDDIKIIIRLLDKTVDLDDYDDMFNIKNVYESQKDIIQELIEKKKVYNDPYNKTLVSGFNKLFPDQSMLKRLIIGNYDRPEEMLLRPMAKFTQEIARDIKLIK